MGLLRRAIGRAGRVAHALKKPIGQLRQNMESLNSSTKTDARSQAKKIKDNAKIRKRNAQERTRKAGGMTHQQRKNLQRKSSPAVQRKRQKLAQTVRTSRKVNPPKSVV